MKKKQGKRKSVTRQKSESRTTSSRNLAAKAVSSQPPIFDSQSAKELFGRLQTENLSQLAQWQEGKAEDDFADLHTCEASLLTALLFHKLGLWQEVCQASEKFLSEIDDLLIEESSSVRKEQCRRNAGFLIEIVGQSYVHLENYHQAAICFETAIELNPSMQSGYLHWSELAQQLGMRDLAVRIVAAGLKKIPSSPELRMYQQAVTNRQTVSVCMIVKNEEEFLEDCLLSIRDIADEIILVDTGSDDRTVEIAESFGCKIYHQPWEGDFSKHRNYSIEQASSDWIFIIDADERLIDKDIPQLKDYLQKKEYDLLSLTVYNVAERSGGNTTVLPSVRIFRRDLKLRYEGIVHNRLNFSDSMKELRCPVGLLHHGYDLSPEKMKLKHERSLALLHKQIEQDEKNAFAHFNLAQLIRARGNLGSESDCQAVLRHATRVIELTDPKSLEFGSIHLMAYHQQATAWHELGKYEQAADACLNALTIDSSYLDCVITLAHSYRSQKLYTKAAKRYTDYLELQKKYSAHQQTDTLIIIHLDSRANVYYNLGLIAEAQNNFSQALGQYQQALAETADYLDANTRAGWVCYRLADNKTAQRYFRRDIEVSPLRASAYLGLVETFSDSGELGAAEATLRSGLKATNSASPILARYSDILSESSRANQALELLASHQRATATDPKLLAARGRAELAFNRTSEARESFLASEGLSAGDIRVRTGLADSSLILGNNSEACEWYVLALADDPHSAHLLRNYAIALARIGKFAESVERFAEYTPIAPDDRESRFIMGALLLRLERGAEALQVYEELLLQEPSDEEALLALSDCYMSLGGSQAAEVGYKRLLAANPNHAIAKERLKALATEQTHLIS